MITSLSIVLPIKLACLGSHYSSQWGSSLWGPWASSSVFSCLLCLPFLCLPLSCLVPNSFRMILLSLMQNATWFPFLLLKIEGLIRAKVILLTGPGVGGLHFLLNAWFNSLDHFLCLEYSRTPEEYRAGAACSGISECGKCCGSRWFPSPPSSAYSLA